ncbi:MAG: antibiotic biosynthesis monooxygenase [Propionicimonas sp.]|nr:antibiotic biosynthesis monooxygenase [Propionicimonas sp.]
MSLYSRYTAFRYDPSIEQALSEAWAATTGTTITRQPGFVGAQLQRSVETDGVRRSVTTWRSREAFESFYHGPDHGALNAVFAELGVQITERDGSEVLWRLSPAVGEVRVVRSHIEDLARLPELERFWQEELGPYLRSRPGLRQVEAAVSEAESLFVLILHWESPEVADTFVSSDEHEERVSRPLRTWTRKLGRDDLRPLD